MYAALYSRHGWEVSVERHVAIEHHRPPPRPKQSTNTMNNRMLRHNALSPPAPPQHQRSPPKPHEADQTSVPAETSRDQKAKHQCTTKAGKSPASVVSKGAVACEQKPAKEKKNTTT